MSDVQVLRSVLYMPSSNERALEKAKALPADAIIFDLEDAVAPDAKAEARQAGVAALQEGGFAPRVGVRINGLETPWGADDLAALSGLAPAFVVAPKIESAHAAREVAGRLPDGADLLESGGLGDGRDGVLEVEGQRVGGERPGLLQRAGVEPGM